MIPVNKPDITESDVDAVIDCVRSGWISGIAPVVDSFERAFAEFVGAKYAVASNSGSTALILALAGHKIGKGDEVIVPDFTMVASANAVKFVGAKPVFVDAELDTMNMNPALIEEKVTKRTKAIMPVHIYGHPCHMDAIVRMAEYYNLLVIDDAAEAFGSEFCGHRLGSFTDATCFSLYANKTITSGEGGVVTTQSKELYERMKWLRAQAFGKDRHFYHEDFGYGFRMSGLQAALGLSQLHRAEKLIHNRRVHASIYYENLSPIAEIGNMFLPTEKSYAKNTFWMYTILTRQEQDRDKLMAYLQEHDVETRPAFTPMHSQPIYKKKGDSDNAYPVASYLGKHGLNLPSGNALSTEEINEVCHWIGEYFKWTSQATSNS